MGSSPASDRGAAPFGAGVVELVDTPDLGSGGASLGGSSPFARTTGAAAAFCFSSLGWTILRCRLMSSRMKV